MKKITLFIALLAMSVMSYALNPFAYALSSSLSEDGAVLTVNYSLNAEATAVSVEILDGEAVVKAEDCSGLGLTAGAYTAEIVLADLPAGSYNWQVLVEGASVNAPTQHETTYSFYHPSGVDIDNNPENPTFGLILTNEGMQSVASKTEGYISAGFGAGIFAFTPAFEPILNGDKPGYNGGIEFTTTRADGTGTAYAPRRVRISEDGRIFVTSLNTDGNYLWEVNPTNLDEWTPVFQGGKLNEQAELLDADSNFIAAPNNGFDVKGSGENLQLAMYSVNLNGITAAAMGGFRLHEYNLGTATEWTTTPSKTLIEGLYVINYTGTQVEYDDEGGFWIASYRGTASDDNPGLVHINAQGVEDLKLVWNNVRQAGIRFNHDFSKLIVAGNNGAAKKATIYAVSKDENGAPVLTEETVIDMAVLGNNLNDFAYDYAGNLYGVSNSGEKIVAWAMPYKGVTTTPAAEQYKFELAGSNPGEDDITYEPFELTNLVVTPMGTFELLEASDPMMQLEVTLGYKPEDGTLMDGSSITFGGEVLTIVEGLVTKFYSEDLATDVYVAKLIVEFMGNQLGLELTMYAGANAEPVEVTIEDATASVDELDVLSLTATWDGYPVLITVAGYEEAEFKEYEGTQISELQIGDDNNWLDFAVANAVAVFKDGNVITLEGEYTSWATGTTYYVMASGVIGGSATVEPVTLEGTVKRALQYYDATIVLTHEEDGTAHIYSIYEGVANEMSQEGIIARDPENLGDLLAISDIALTEDGKLVACNSMVCQAAEDYIDEGYKRGETRFYIWDDFESNPKLWFKSNMYGNWFRSKEGASMALKGDSENAQIMVTSIHATKYWSRFSVYSVIDGVYNEPANAADGNEHYTWCEGPANGDLDENVLGTKYELLASPIYGNWIVDGELGDPIEFTQPETIKAVIAEYAPVNTTFGKVFSGASVVQVGDLYLLVAPYANEEGLLEGVQVLNINKGLANAEYVDLVTPFDAPMEAKSVATAVEVLPSGLNVSLVVDNVIYPTTVGLEIGSSDYEVYEDEITNLVIDLDNLVLIGGPSSAFQVDVFLGLGEYNRNDDTYQLLPESSIAVMGSDATFIDGYAYEVDAFTPSAKAVVHCEWNGMLLEFHLTMTAAPMEATVVVVENATVEVEKYLLFGDMYDYALKMTGEWVNEEDGLTYPVLVEVPVYYPEATEPSEIMSTVTVGGWGDNDPWLGFGEGTLTVTTVDNVVTATGIVQNPMAGIAIDITISGSITDTGIENATVTIKPVKMIKNNQLIIEKDGVQYNVNGAIIK